MTSLSVSPSVEGKESGALASLLSYITLNDS